MQRLCFSSENPILVSITETSPGRFHVSRCDIRSVREVWGDTIGVLLVLVFLTQLRFYLQVIVSGKLRAARAKSMKFKDGYMISSGSPVNDYIDSAVRHVMLRQV